MSTTALVRGFAAMKAKAPLESYSFKLDPIRAHDVEIEVQACSICHSDVHLIDDDWGISRFPLVPGHEVVGKIVDRGAAVTTFAVGDIVGVGWQCGACGQCVACTTGHSNLCTGGKRRTCVDQPGAFASRVRSDERFAFKLPAGLDAQTAAPLFCAGVTVFAPLLRHHIDSKSRVAVVGLGGLGHLAVQFARGFGAEVTVFDPQEGKRDEARALGAERLHGVDQETLARLTASSERYDFVLSTTPASLVWDQWLNLVALNGTLCLAGIPLKPLKFSCDHLIDGQKKVTGSAIGSPDDMRAMLTFAAKHRVQPHVETTSFANVNAALEKVRQGQARYRMVLTGGL